MQETKDRKPEAIWIVLNSDPFLGPQNSTLVTRTLERTLIWRTAHIAALDSMHGQATDHRGNGALHWAAGGGHVDVSWLSRNKRRTQTRAQVRGKDSEQIPIVLDP